MKKTNQRTREKTLRISCESFRSFGLDHLWQNHIGAPPLIESFGSHSLNAMASVPPPMQQHEVSPSQRLFTSDDLYAIRRRYESQEEVPNYALQQQQPPQSIPSGPNGPFVELKHTESSGFSTVVPHKTCEAEGLNDELSFMNARGAPCGEKEENLLTSPRTHFRPNRQDSNGSTTQDDSGGAVVAKASAEEPAPPAPPPPQTTKWCFREPTVEICSWKAIL